MLTTTKHSARTAALSLLSCAIWLVGGNLAGCNDVLAIHEPSTQLLDADAGTIALRDSGVRSQRDASLPATKGGTAGGPATDAGHPSSNNQPSAPQDAGASDAPSATADVSPYVWANWPMPNPQATGLPNPQGYATLASAASPTRSRISSGQQFSDDKTRSWSDAMDYCHGLMLGGSGNWRLPSRIELLSLVDYTVASPTIDAPDFLRRLRTRIGRPRLSPALDRARGA